MFTMEHNAKVLIAVFDGLERSTRDLKPVWSKVHRIFLAFMREQFKSEGAYANVKWAPLNPAYAAYKAKRWGRRRILEASGTLKDSLTQEKHPDHIYKTGPSFMETGTRVRYAKAHHYGYPPGNLPQRVILAEFTKAEGERVVDAVLAHILKGKK